jgi:lysophospholipase L1-like esterase
MKFIIGCFSLQPKHDYFLRSLIRRNIVCIKSVPHLLLALCVLCFLSAVSLAQGFEAEIRAFEQADLVSPPPAKPVLFVGSSSIRVWPDLAGDFPDYPVMNRGFGGSQMKDVLYYFDRIVAPYDPALILVYEGDNDLAAGKSVDMVYADYVKFLALVEEQLPNADIAFIATKPSPSRSGYLEVTRQLNIRLEELVSNNSQMWFIDIFTPMLDENGQPRRELFSGDMLHMNAAGYDLWQSIIEPFLAEWAMPIDLNGDGIIDAADMCIMVDHWGENYSLCDIGPTPLGDGIVDVEDLVVLAGHLFEEVSDPTLIAHWPLDETEGMVVADSAGDNNGYALSGPVWQPDGGLVDGALQLDGVDDYVLTGFGPNPEKGSFSVLVWIKGGAPGQAILSQMGGANWLCADASDGNLMTELRSSGRAGKPLQSQTNITDGNWHRIGFVWDGFNRKLYVDSIIAAEDTQDSLHGSNNGLYIGTDKAMEAGTFWSGLIDDVRIYNRVVIP